MAFEQQIRKSFQHASRRMTVPPELGDRVAKQIFNTSKSTGRKRMRTVQRIAVCMAIGGVILTGTAFAAPNFADRIYGSYEELKKKVVTVSMQQYQKIGMKFAGAAKELGSDYPAFEQLSKQMVAAKVDYGDKNWQIDFSALSPETYAELNRLYADIQPYFDRLNHEPVARDALSPEEYDKYIALQMQRESILAQAGVDPSVGRIEQNLPEKYYTAYEETKRSLKELESKIRQSRQSR
ncbi:DUF3600 domain-containing protein [Paenibacillus hamazuiensis]|uniref:DUF3600 domain-containing protein n=1 Tax=Paenibacillus hamazuiensis TaxID=2936508 RepID=UPI00200CE926|nr:DUF3600 domain-containing protein [Paenibacillus hamazuiensis]